ncbi:DinB family protein [Kiloniella sp.]|uniref:DinB family protein n=1 Tax=Kiloniella sp. TaxID=1938587 RepID=UPI003B010F29
MNQTAILTMMARYNQRMNSQLLSVCAGLSQEQLHRDTGSFFCSILDYWNHIMFSDLVLMARMRSQGINPSKLQSLDDFPAATSPKDRYYDSLESFSAHRHKLDVILSNWCETLSTKDISSILSYQSTQGDHVRQKAIDIIHHIFQHQTHHRGQITCLLSLNGVDYGCTDLPVIVAEGSV